MIFLAKTEKMQQNFMGSGQNRKYSCKPSVVRAPKTVKMLQNLARTLAFCRRTRYNRVRTFAGVLELADETDSKSVAREGVWVRVPPPACMKIRVVSSFMGGGANFHFQPPKLGLSFLVCHF